MDQSAVERETAEAVGDAEVECATSGAGGAAPSEVNERDSAMLLEWLNNHDEQCPSCGYNLRGLARPVCPECSQDLVLTVGARQLQLGWWIVAMVPGFFSGIAALFLAVPLTLSLILDPSGQVPWPIVIIDAFGFASGIAAIALARKRTWFLRRSREEQKRFAVGVWAVHVFVFFGFVGLVWYFG